jgi:hypothetical protein
MPIPFTCPHCGHKTDVEDQYAGQSGPCVACGKTIAVPPLPCAVHYEPRKRKPLPAVVSIITLVLIVLIVAVGLLLICSPLVVDSPEAARRMQCTSNLKQLALALLNYESAHGTFPPAYVTDKDGKRLYSWRVLILPYLDCRDLYEAFHLDESWDSPHNRPLMQTYINVFHCPSDPSGAAEQTSYVMVVGPHMASEGPKGRSLREIRDGTANTILLVEMSNSGICWSEPRDWEVPDGPIAVNDPNVPGPRSEHPARVVSVAFCDGSSKSLKESIDPKLLRALLTVDGGEDVRAFFEE